ncbi:MAG: VPLPA-CTERM sorting domain-containing protein [Sneathiella sp.]
MKKILATLFALALSCTAAQAATFDFTGNGGRATSYTFVEDGISVTASPASFNNGGGTSTSPSYRVGQYGGGLGMSRYWGENHQVDGWFGNDLIVFDFDRNVTIESVSFTHVDRDDEFSFFFDLGNDGSLDDINFNVDIPGSGTYSFFGTWTGDTFGIGAYDYNDNFKISGMTVSAVPLPAALPLYGAGMAVIGFIGWRRKKRLAA